MLDLTMGQLYNTLVHFLNQEDWPFPHVEEGSIASLGLQIESQERED